MTRGQRRKRAGIGAIIILAGIVWLVIDDQFPRPIILAMFGRPGGYAEQLDLMGKAATLAGAFDIFGYAVIFLGAWLLLRAIIARRQT
jgi:hypothetical protein